MLVVLIENPVIVGSAIAETEKFVTDEAIENPEKRAVIPIVYNEEGVVVATENKL